MAKRRGKRAQSAREARHGAGDAAQATETGKKSDARPSHEAKHGKAASHRGAPGRRRHLPNWPVLVLALAGMALTGYLSAVDWLHQAPAYCTAGGGCSLVQSSRWGTFLGLPTAFWGFMGYAALGHIAYRVRSAERHWKLSWVIAAVGLAISVYLTAVAELVIGATCFYCLTSLGLMAALFVVISVQWPRGMEGFRWPVWGGEVALLCVLVVGGLYLNYSGVFNAAMGPEDPYLKGLAEHLTKSGDQFYGAFW